MRIAIISTAALPTPPLKYGGMERAVNWLVKGLQELGHDVVLFAKEGSKGYAKAIEYGETEAEFAELIELWIKKKAIDIIIDFSHNKTVAMTYPEFPQMSTWQVMQYHWAHNPVFISKAQAAYFDRADAPVIYYGLDMTEYPVNLRRGDDVLYMGAITRHKRPLLAAEAARRLDKKLILAGPMYDDGYKQTFDNMLAMDHVEYVGPVGGQEKLDLMHRACCLCHPVGGHGWFEAGALVVLEAWSMGIPIVGTTNGCLPEYIRAAKNGYLASDNPEDISDCIKWACDLSTVTVLASFDGQFLYTHMAFEYEKLCREVLQGRVW